MEFTNENLNLENGLTKEWLITNGLGGYSSSTIIGANTRKYHGLLIAPLTPPARRYLILSKLDESIEVQGRKYDLYTNVCQNYISNGYKYLVSFEKDYVPVFKYKIGQVEIIKKVCMEYGRNTVGVYYKITTGRTKAKLTLAPVVNFRDFHTMSTNHNFELRQTINKNKVKLVIDNNSQTPVYMHISDGKYVEHQNDIFRQMFYIEEQKRGFYPEENHVVPGVYEVEIPARQEKEISFICSLEENIEQKNAKDFIIAEEKRTKELIEQSKLIENDKDSKKTKKQQEKDKLIEEMLIAADNFIAFRPSFGLHTIIAGYPWFLDWGRDSLISFEGLTLITRRWQIAKEILQTMVRDIKYGLVPNGYSGYDNRPLYNSVDASLLLFEEIEKYVEYTGDYKFVKDELFEKLEDVIDSYCRGIDVDENNIYLDKDGLIVSGTAETQNTWMDAKSDGIAFTPRNGKAVEINAMWYNANMIMEKLCKKFRKILKAKKYRELAENCKSAFESKFYNQEKKCLYDVLGDSKIRPNQLFALSLTYPVIDPASSEAEDIMKTVESKLLNPYGLKTLAKGEPNYVEIYEGDGKKRDSSYHQGITWPWLLGLYYNALKKIVKATGNGKDKLDDFITKTTKTFKKEVEENGCIGSIAEIYDSALPQLPKGAIAQAWSVAEVFRIIIGG